MAIAYPIPTETPHEAKENAMHLEDFTQLEKLLLTPREAATAMRISPRKLWGMTAAGEIAVVKLGRAVRYTREALLSAIADHEVK